MTGGSSSVLVIDINNGGPSSLPSSANAKRYARRSGEKDQSIANVHKLRYHGEIHIDSIVVMIGLSWNGVGMIGWDGMMIGSDVIVCFVCMYETGMGGVNEERKGRGQDD